MVLLCAGVFMQVPARVAVHVNCTYLYLSMWVGVHQLYHAYSCVSLLQCCISSHAPEPQLASDIAVT